MILQFVVTYVPALQSIFKTQALSWKEFLLLGLCQIPRCSLRVEIENGCDGKKLITKI